MSKKFISRYLSLESLESRTVLTGNVTASVLGGSLVVQGDAAVNWLQIDQIDLPAGSFRLSAVDIFDPSPTTINGLAGPVVLTGVAKDILMNSGGGEFDSFSIVNANVPRDVVCTGSTGGEFFGVGAFPGNTSSVGRDLIVNGGDGGNTASIGATNIGRDFLVTFGTSASSFTAINVSTIGRDYRVTTGNIDDFTVSAESSSVGRDIAVTGGNGFDHVLTFDNTIGRSIVLALGTGDTQVVSAGNLIGKDLRVTSGTGADFLSITGSNNQPIPGTQIGGKVEISTGDGDTFMGISNLTTSSLSIINGVGTDLLFPMTTSTITGNAVIAIGNGGDFGGGVSIDQTMIGGNLTITGGDKGASVSLAGVSVGGNTTIDTVAGTGFLAFGRLVTFVGEELVIIPAVFHGNLDIHTGSGNDFIFAAEFEVHGNTTINTGGGIDQVFLGFSFGFPEPEVTRFHGNLRIDTGDGDDVLALDFVQVDGTTDILAGGGGDAISIVNSLFLGSVLVDGGTGSDTFSESGNTFAGGLVVINL